MVVGASQGVVEDILNTLRVVAIYVLNYCRYKRIVMRGELVP
jgi:hypothetical protein